MRKKLSEHQAKILRTYDANAIPKKHSKANKTAVKLGIARKRIEDIMEARALKDEVDFL